MKWSASLLGLLFLVLVMRPCAAQRNFDELAKLIPSTANALVNVNVEKALDSPLSRQEGWELKGESAFKSGLTILPAKARNFILATELDLEVMEPKWEIAVATMKEPPLTREIADRHGTNVDPIRGKPSVALSNDAYVVKFNFETFGAIAPADRQSTSDWIHEANTKTAPTISPYLMSAVGFSQNVGSEIIMAIDLHDIFSPAMVRQRLATTETLAGRQVDLDALATALSSIQGVTLGIVINKELAGSIKVDFSEDISLMSDFAKSLLLEALGKNGAMIEDFATWQSSVSANQVRLSGPLSETGARMVMSLFDARTSAFISPSQAGQSQDDNAADASLKYFNSVQILLSDLNALKPKTKTWGQKAIWYDRYARKIEGLPLLGVDPSMLDYGQYVANALREASGALKGIATRSRYRSTTMGGSGAVSNQQFMNFHSYGVNLNYQTGTTQTFNNLVAQGQESARMRTQEKLQGTSRANAIMTEVEQTTAQVRRAMTEKYQVEF